MRAPALMALLLPILLLAACSTRPLAPPEGVAADDARLAECRREAANAPEVRDIRRRMPPSADGTNFTRAQDDIRDAEQGAFVDCLVRVGVFERPAGGVERVRAPRFGADPAPTGAALPSAPRPSTTGY
jgi:hypothetical protein